MNLKTRIFGAGLALVAGTIVTISSCTKESPAEMLNPSAAAATQNDPQRTTNSLATIKAYNAAYTVGGSCTGGPLFLKNSVINYFGPTNGASETIVNNENCNITGLARNGCLMYCAIDNGSASELWRIQSNGSLVYVGNIMYGSNPLRVQEMECTTNGDLYIVGGNGLTWALYYVPFASLSNTTINATLRGNIIGNNSAAPSRVSLSHRPINDKLYITWERVGFTGTNVQEVSKTTGALVGTAVNYSLPNTNTSDFGTYYYNDKVMFGKNGVLYELNGSGSYTNNGNITMSTRNDMTYLPACNN